MHGDQPCTKRGADLEVHNTHLLNLLKWAYIPPEAQQKLKRASRVQNNNARFPLLLTNRVDYLGHREVQKLQMTLSYGVVCGFHNQFVEWLEVFRFPGSNFYFCIGILNSTS